MLSVIDDTIPLTDVKRGNVMKQNVLKVMAALCLGFCSLAAVADPVHGAIIVISSSGNGN